MDFHRRRPRRLRPQPPKRGLMAAVGCTDRAKTSRALPPVPLAFMLQALPRLGWHASRLPCKPWEQVRCTNLARRAAVGAMPLKYHGGRGSCLWGATTRRAVRGAQGRPKTRKPRAEFTRPVQRSRFQVLRGDRRVPPERGSAGTVTAGEPGALDARPADAGFYPEHRRRAPLGPGAVPLVFLSPHFFGKKWGPRPGRPAPRGGAPDKHRATTGRPYVRRAESSRPTDRWFRGKRADVIRPYESGS